MSRHKGRKGQHKGGTRGRSGRVPTSPRSHWDDDFWPNDGGYPGYGGDWDGTLYDSGYGSYGRTSSHSQDEVKRLSGNTWGQFEGIDIVYTQTAYMQAVSWARYWFPDEFNLIPVCALRLRDGSEKSPMLDIDIDDVEAIIVKEYICPPYQNNSGGHTSIVRSRREEVSVLMTDRLQAMRDAQPRLGRFIKFHCHPFVGGGRFLSSGDINSNLRGNALHEWQEDTSMMFVPMQVIYPHDKDNWNIATFLEYGGNVLAVKRPWIMKEDRTSKWFDDVSKPVWWNSGWLASARQAMAHKWGDKAQLNDIGRGYQLAIAPIAGGMFVGATIPPDLERGMEVFMVRPDENGDPDSTSFLYRKNLPDVPFDIVKELQSVGCV